MKTKQSPGIGGTTSGNTIGKKQGKDSEHNTQLQTIFHFLKSNIATASMVSDATGIPQKNICRYKRDLEQAGLLWEVSKSYCQLTGFKAWYLTTNPCLVSSPKQLKIF